MEGNNLNNMNVENNSNNIQPSVVNNQPTVETVTPMETQVPMAPVQPVAPAAPMAPTAQPVVENNTTPNIGTNPNNQDNGKKKSPILFIILGLVLVAVIGAVVFFLLTNKDKEENKDADKKPEEQENKPTVDLNWNGVYENEHGTISLYEINNDELIYQLVIDDTYMDGTAYIDGNTAEDKIFDTYTFVLNGNTLEFTTDDEQFISGTFTKVKDYTKEDYYTDNIGDASYLETGINGVYENNGITITVYQTKDDHATIIIAKAYSVYNVDADVVNGAILYQDEFFDDINSISASIADDTLVITASSTDVESLLNEVSGTYTRTKTLTIDDIIDLEM